MDYILLGSRIRESRINRHVSQQQMAQKLNFSQQHICNVEHGMAHPSLDLLVDISNILNVPLDYLLQDSLKRKNAGNGDNILSDVQYFLDNQELEIHILQKLLQDIS